jgi:ribosomal protein S12
MHVKVMQKPPLLKISGVNDGEEVVIVTVAQNDHKLDEGDEVVLDDMRGDLAHLEGLQFQVRHVAFLSPKAAELDIASTEYKEALKLGTGDLLANYERQYVLG